MQAPVLDKESSVPLHQQLYLNLKAAIESGLYKEHYVLPSELEMQKQYNVSRITVRRALSDLEHDGYIQRRKGIGTLILPQKKDRSMSIFQSYSGAVIAKGDVPGSVLLRLEEIEVGVKISEKLKIPVGEKVCFLKRLRLINNEIVGIHESYISLHYGCAVIREDFSFSFSLYDFFESKNIALGSADEYVEARMPSNDLRKELYMDINVPVIYKERVTYDVDGNPVEYSENSYSGNRYKYYIHLSKARGSN